jgi:hypothetical protein
MEALMDQNDALSHLNRLVDGQSIRVTTASGRVFDGIYDGAQSSLEDGLYFETLEGNPLRADWDKVQQIGFRSARAVGGQIMVPPEHPLSGENPNALRPYTVRNPIPGAK